MRLLSKQMLRLAAVYMLLTVVLSAPAFAQAPVLLIASSPSTVIATGRSEVIGPLTLVGWTTCGNSADGKCVSTAGSIDILYVGIPIENNLGSGITVGEVVGGVRTLAPVDGALITGDVTVSNTARGGLISIGIKGGADLAAGDQLIILGVRGQIVSSPGSVPGTALRAQASTSANVEFLIQAEGIVAVSATGLEFVSASPCQGCDDRFTISYREGFSAAFAQYLATGITAAPANARPLFGATNNTQLRLTVANLNGRITWPATVRSPLAGGGGLLAGGSELKLISQNFNGARAIYEFTTADQEASDRAQETFAITPVVCGEGTFSIQAQLFPDAAGRPAFDDPPIPSPAATFSVATRCRPAPLAIVSGDSQVAVAGSELPAPLVVKVQDANGDAVLGATVNFSAATSGGSVTRSSVVTDLQGLAQTRARLGTDLGNYFFTARVDSVSATFMATALPVQVPIFPFRVAVPHIPSGGGFLTRLVIVNGSQQPNHIQANFISPSGALLRTATQTLPPNGRLDLSTGEAERFANPTTQWALIGSDFPLGVNAFFDARLASADTSLIAVSLPASEPRQNFAVPLSFAQDARSGTVSQTTGIAMANASSRPNQVTVELRDVGGLSRALDTITLPPFGQTAFGISDLPAAAAVLRSEQLFFGTINIRAGEPASLLAVGREFSQLFALADLARVSACGVFGLGTNTTTIIPQLPAGDGWGIEITVTNVCPFQNAVRFEMFEQDGTRSVNNLAPDTTLPSQGTAFFFTAEADRFGPATVRWVRITSQLDIGVHVRLDFKPNAAADPLIAVGSSSIAPALGFALPVELGLTPQGETQTVGLALANITDTADDIVLRLVDRLGQVVAEDTSIHLGPRGQTTFGLPDLPSFRQALPTQSEFTGTLFIIASQPTAILAVGREGTPAFGIPPLPRVGTQQ